MYIKKKKSNNEVDCERDGSQKKKKPQTEIVGRIGRAYICHECHSTRAIPANSFLSTVLKV